MGADNVLAVLIRRLSCGSSAATACETSRNGLRSAKQFRSLAGILLAAHAMPNGTSDPGRKSVL